MSITVPVPDHYRGVDSLWDFKRLETCWSTEQWLSYFLSPASSAKMDCEVIVVVRKLGKIRAFAETGHVKRIETNPKPAKVDGGLIGFPMAWNLIVEKGWTLERNVMKYECVRFAIGVSKDWYRRFGWKLVPYVRTMAFWIGQLQQHDHGLTTDAMLNLHLKLHGNHPPMIMQV